MSFFATLNLAKVGVQGKTTFLQNAQFGRTLFGPQKSVQVRQGSNRKEVKGRLKAIKNIQKITKTMKMIASARLREAQNRMNRMAPFFNTSEKLFQGIPSPKKGKVLIVVISSDRGLCGGINSNIAKQVKNLMKTYKTEGRDVELACIGDKAMGILSRDFSKQILFSVGGTGRAVLNFTGIGVIADELVSKDWESVTVVYTKFVSTLVQAVTVKELNNYSSLLKDHSTKFNSFEFEDDSRKEHLRDYVEYYLGGMILNGITQSAASEQAARMTAMENATKSASEMLKRLTVAYNKARQTAITTELTEIISGSAAVQA